MNYLYQGDQAVFSLRTLVGRLVLPQGQKVELSDTIHEQAIQHPIIRYLIEQGHIVLSQSTAAQSADAEVHAASQTSNSNTPVDSSTSQASSAQPLPNLTLAQLRSRLNTLGIRYPRNAKRAALLALLPKE